MKAGQTQLEVGARILVLAIDSEGPADAVGVVGSEGEITHPFGDSPGSVAGVWVAAHGTVPFGVTFPDNRIGLFTGDIVKVLDTGEVVTL